VNTPNTRHPSHAAPASSPDSSPSGLAIALGIGGLLPFVVLALVVWFGGPWRGFATGSLMAYGALIVSFLGGIHWGLAMREGVAPRAHLVWGISASLLAWVSILLPRGIDLMALGATLVACWVADRALYPRLGLQGWMGLRTQLTLIASLSCLGAGVAFWIP
jgi:hypothetical protein